MEWYGIAGAALLGLSFYLARRVPSFLASGAAVVAGFVAATRGRGADRAPEWYVTTAGLLAAFAGLLIVRLMLMRSVSLRLLGRVDRGAGRGFDDDIGIRVREMRVFGLARRTRRGNALTPLGRAVAGVVAPLYRALRIDR